MLTPEQEAFNKKAEDLLIHWQEHSGKSREQLLQEWKRDLDGGKVISSIRRYLVEFLKNTAGPAQG